MDELRLALRRLFKRPAVSLVSVLTLACAIGSAIATWSLLSAILLHPLPVRDADRVVVAGQLTTVGPRAGTSYDGLGYPYLAAFRSSGVFEQVAAEWTSSPVLLTRAPAEAPASRDRIGFATWNLFDLLGVRVVAGRPFTAGDDRRGAPPVAILTDDYWSRRFERRAEAIGATIVVAGKPVIVVGIAQPGFRGLELAAPVDAYLPFHVVGDIGSPMTNYFADAGHASSPTDGTKVIARLRPGTTVEDVERQMAAVGATADQRPRRPVLTLTPIGRAAVPSTGRAGMARVAGLLGATTALLLLIGSATTGMLLLIRTEARRDEFAMCRALGASPARLASGVVLEGAVLSAAGAVLAVPVAWWWHRISASFELPGAVAIGRLGLSFDISAMNASVAAAFTAAMLMASIAATVAIHGGAADALRSRAGATPRVTRRRTRALLVVIQVAVTVVLVTGAGVFARSLAAALQLNAGLEMDRVVTGYINLAPHGYTAARAQSFFADLRQRLEANGTVASTAYGIDRGGMMGRMTVNGVPQPFASQVGFAAVDPKYFGALGIRLSSGRDFVDRDRVGSPPVTIVSESFARALAPGGSPIGMRITMPFSIAGRPPDVMEVVGVVDDVVTRVTELEPLLMYFPLAQVEPGLTRTLVVRSTNRNGGAVEREILASIKAVDPAVIPQQVMTLERRIEAQMGPQRFAVTVLGALGSIAVLLTLMGVYVLGETAAAMREREMGIRAALGATGRQMAWLVCAESGRLVALGLLIGLVAARLGIGAARVLLFRVAPSDPVTFVLVPILMLTLIAAASLRPALRAARIDLAAVLRES